MITLFHAPNTRAGTMVWLLEELGVPYELSRVNLKRADGSGAADSANPHPHHKVPALKDGDECIYESAAITLYLTDKYRQVKLGPLPGEPKRGEYLSWLAYRPGVLEPALLMRRFEVKHVYGAMGWAPADDVERHLGAHLASRAFFLGEEFSGADVLVGSAINFMMQFKLMQETSVFKSYAARITARPAFRRMLDVEAKSAQQT